MVGCRIGQQAASLVTQRLDRIEVRRFYCRVEAKKQPDTLGNGDSQKDRPDRNGRGKLGHQKIDQKAEAAAQEHSYHTASSSQRHGLSEELPDDVATPRPDGFAHTDFAGELGDRHQHNIHYPHTTDEKSNRTDNGDKDGNGRGNLAELIGHLLGTADIEIIRLVEGHIATAAKQTTNFVFGGWFFSGIHGRPDEILVVLRVVLAVAPVRNQNGLVGLRITKKLPLVSFQHANNLERHSIDQNGFSDG